MIIFRFPNIQTLDLRAAVEAMRSYLWQLAETLNRELQTLEGKVDGIINGGVKAEPTATFNGIKAMIAGSRDIADGMRKQAEENLSIPASGSITLHMAHGSASILIHDIPLDPGAWIIGASDAGKSYAISLRSTDRFLISAGSINDVITITNNTASTIKMRRIKLTGG